MSDFRTGYRDSDADNEPLGEPMRAVQRSLARTFLIRIHPEYRIIPFEQVPADILDEALEFGRKGVEHMFLDDVLPVMTETRPFAGDATKTETRHLTAWKTDGGYVTESHLH